MSEFSESYHLRSERAADAIELLRYANRKGYVYQPVHGWVTFVAEEGIFEPDERIVAAAISPLLHYVSAGDHGWNFALYDRARIVSRYRCDWNDEVEFDDSEYSRVELKRYIPVAQSGLLDDFERRLHPKNFDELFEVEPSKLFAQAVGLEHYDWLSYEGVAYGYREIPADYVGVIAVS